jgi:two-component system, cell cycle sensor histidine kinase and response regulator CckA
MNIFFTFVDLIIIGCSMGVLIFLFHNRRALLATGAYSSIGLVALGTVAFATVFAFDLCVIWVLPLFIGAELAEQIDRDLHVYYDWLPTVVAVLCTSVGLTLFTKRLLQLLGEMRLAHEQLRQSEGRLRQAIQLAGMGSWEWDIQTDDVRWSEEMFAIYGIDPAGFTGKGSDYFEYTHPEDRQLQADNIARVIEDSIAAAQNTDESEHIESQIDAAPKGFRLIRPDGELRQVLGNARVVIDAGVPVRMLGFNMDITEHVRMEERIIQSQKVESIGQLAGGIAHDFNNMLLVILNCCDMLEVNASVDDEGHTDLQLIREAGERAARLTQQILAFSRRQVLRPRMLDLNEVIGHSYKMLNRLIPEDIQLSIQLDNSPLIAFCDPIQIDQVMVNLVVNARDAMPDGGQLTIETSVATIGNGNRTVEPGRYARLSVIDTGVGMEEELRMRIFEPFFTTKGIGKGTGMGLATAYGIIRQSGGFVEVESKKGDGSRFDVYLPLSEEGSVDLLERDDLSLLRGTETVLVAEDDKTVRDQVERMLRKLGYEVLTAVDGLEALELWQEYGNQVDLVLTDVVMPRMKGGDLVSDLREIRPDLKVVFMSGYIDETIARSDLLDASAPLLRKPFALSELASTVRQTLDT